MILMSLIQVIHGVFGHHDPKHSLVTAGWSVFQHSWRLTEKKRTSMNTSYIPDNLQTHPDFPNLGIHFDFGAELGV